MVEKNDRHPDNEISLPHSVGIIYSEVKREYFSTETQYLTERDALPGAKVIASYLEQMGIETHLFPGDVGLSEKLQKEKPDMVLNLVDSIRGNEALSATIPALLEPLKIPYTGARFLGESLAHNKFLVKKLLEQNDVSVPHYQLFNTPKDDIDGTLRFPLISKLNEIHGAVEITKDAISESEKHLRDRLKFLIDTYKRPVLVEEFITGREITAIVLEGSITEVYLAEKVFSNLEEKYIFATFDAQWADSGKASFHYERFKDSQLSEMVKKVFEVTEMADYGKIDIRLDASGKYYFIDCNTNPAFGPKELDCAIANIFSLYDINFFDILKRLLTKTSYHKDFCIR